MKSKNVALFLVLMTAMFVSTACLIVGAPTVKTLPPESVAKMKEVLAESIPRDVIPPDWIIGIIFQERYQHGYGINSDPINKVRFKVFIPNDLITIIPCNPRQEMHLVRDYDPGDLIAFDLPSGRSRTNAKQDEAYICRDQIMLITKAVLGPPIEENAEGLIVPSK